MSIKGEAGARVSVPTFVDGSAGGSYSKGLVVRPEFAAPENSWNGSAGCSAEDGHRCTKRGAGYQDVKGERSRRLSKSRSAIGAALGPTLALAGSGSSTASAATVSHPSLLACNVTATAR
jgi:hypothetical protein